ncbi:MAG: hypothetical protein QOF89_2983 [Acidobacteriota bacterium]|nr:hypothetical protein [Acidobacteriota bacterium]
MPEIGVDSAFQPDPASLGRAGEKGIEPDEQASGGVLVQEELQAAWKEVRRCSRSAANSRQAWMSSGVSSG